VNSLIKKDLKYNWHPYTQMKDIRHNPPILIERAKGIKLFDNKGKYYYDTISSWWCNIHGHNHPRIVKAIKNQLNKLDHVMFAGFTHKTAIELSEKLIEITPPQFKKVFYSDNGSTAVEVALKMSFQYWRNRGIKKKNKFISLDAAYHGDTIGTMSVSGFGPFNNTFKHLFFKSYRTITPNCYRCPLKLNLANCGIACIDPLEKILQRHNKEISAIIIEPLLLAAGGMIVYPPKYLQLVNKLAKKYKVHLIVDEVATGFGRTGTMFAIEQVAVKPDFMCLSKGITSGTLAMGVTLCTDQIYKAFYDELEKDNTFYHGHTFSANPLACAAAVESLNIFSREKTLQKIPKLISYFHDKIKKFRALDKVGDVRMIGLVGALELVKNKKTKQIYSNKDGIGLKIYQSGLKKNIILRPLGSVIYFYFPLCITRKEISYVLEETYKIIRNLK